MDARHRTGSDRKSAMQRRETVLEAAMAEFAARGLHGASTETIAREAGIAHSYLFKLFGKKRDLFVAATERVYERVFDLFRTGAARYPDEPLRGMGDAFRDLLASREELLMIIHGFAAPEEDGIRDVVRQRYVQLYRFARERSGADTDEMKAFWSHGMLMIVAAAIDLPSLEDDESWVRSLLDSTH